VDISKKLCPVPVLRACMVYLSYAMFRTLPRGTLRMPDPTLQFITVPDPTTGTSFRIRIRVLHVCMKKRAFYVENAVFITVFFFQEAWSSIAISDPHPVRSLLIWILPVRPLRIRKVKKFRIRLRIRGIDLTYTFIHIFFIFPILTIKAFMF